MPRQAHYLRFRDADGAVIDDGLLIFFPGPQSYTGEDVLELQGHGSPVLLGQLLRRCLALGARPDTFMGLSGLGDLVLTATGDLSRNRTVGLKLAEGKTLDDILRELGHVAEGVYSAATVRERARSLGVDMPITNAVVEVIEGRLTPADAVQLLMAREAKPELPLDSASH